MSIIFFMSIYFINYVQVKFKYMKKKENKRMLTFILYKKHT
jgi:hypothetical protein